MSTYMRPSDVLVYQQGSKPGYVILESRPTQKPDSEWYVSSHFLYLPPEHARYVAAELLRVADLVDPPKPAEPRP